jgi:hypothetical protein
MCLFISPDLDGNRGTRSMKKRTRHWNEIYFGSGLIAFPPHRLFPHHDTPQKREKKRKGKERNPTKKSEGRPDNTQQLNGFRQGMECHLPGNPQDGQECRAPPRSPRMHSKDHVPIHVRDRWWHTWHLWSQAQLICRAKPSRWGSAVLCGSSASRCSSFRLVLLPEAVKTHSLIHQDD